MSSPSRILVVSCLVGTFLAGAVSGGFVKASIETKAQKPPQFSPESMTRRMCDRFAAELGLSLEQRESFEKIIGEESVKIDAAHKRLGSEVHALFLEMDGRLMAVLTPEQQKKFTEFKKQRARHSGRPENDKEKGPGRGSPPSEPPPGPPPQ